MNRYSLLATLLLTAAPALAQDEPRRLTIAPKVGTVAHYRATAQSQQKVSIMPQPSSSEFITDLQVQVDEVAADGKVKATVTWQRLRGSMQSMAGPIRFDTQDPDLDTGNPLFADMVDAFGAMIGQKATLTYGPDGKLVDKKPLDELAAKVRDSLEGPAKMMLEQMVGTRVLEQQASVFGTLPTEPVAVGGKWTVKEEIKDRGGLAMTTETTHQLVTADDEAIVIETSGTVSSAPAKEGEAAEEDDDDDPQVAAQRAMMRQAKIGESKLEGQSRISGKDGLLVGSTRKSKLTIELPNPMGGEEPMTVAVDETTKLERISAEEAAKEAKDAKGSKGADPAPKK